MRRSTWDYRARQLWNAIREQRQPIDHDFVAAHLCSAGLALFYAMSTRDQAHSLNTAALVARSDCAKPDLIAAALLHDAAKGRQRIWERVLYVALDEALPGLLQSLARPGAGTRGALYRSIHHAAVGAELARAVGLPARVCDLIAYHHEPVADAEQRLLQWADAVADAPAGSRLD